MKTKYEEFMKEGTLMVLDCTILDMNQVYDDLDQFIIDNNYEVVCVGYDPYNAEAFIDRWSAENSPFGVEKVRQGSQTESVPLTEIKALAEERMLLFDEAIMQFTMGNSIVIEDTNGNKKLLKKRYEAKIDNVSALMDAFVAYKLNLDSFE
jgi:phage terminase large subunit-like protein